MMTLLNIFHSGGLWIIPLGLLLAGLWSIRRGYISSKSNSTTQLPDGTIEDNTGNVPLTHTPQFWIGIALIVFSIVTFFMINADYRGV